MAADGSLGGLRDFLVRSEGDVNTDTAASGGTNASPAAGSKSPATGEPTLDPPENKPEDESTDSSVGDPVPPNDENPDALRKGRGLNMKGLFRRPGAPGTRISGLR